VWRCQSRTQGSTASFHSCDILVTFQNCIKTVTGSIKKLRIEGSGSWIMQLNLHAAVGMGWALLTTYYYYYYYIKMILVHKFSEKYTKTRKATPPKGLRGFQIYLQPRVNLTFDLLHPSCCDTMCLPGLIKIYRIVLEITRQKGLLWSILALYDLDIWACGPQSWTFLALACWTTCASWHQNWFIRLQNIMFTNLVTDERTDGPTNRQVENVILLPASLTWQRLKNN